MKLDFDIKTKGANLDFDMKDTTVIKTEAQKEIVVVDIQKMLEKQDTTLFMGLSRRYANGEIVIVGSLGNAYGIISGINFFDNHRVHWGVTSGEWETQMLEGGEFKPSVVVYGLECDGEKIVIGSGFIENPDLSDYVKFTDIAKKNKAGLMWSDSSLGLFVDQTTGGASIVGATTADIDGGINKFHPLTPFNMKYAIKKSITTNTETLTADEKASACEWIGAAPRLNPNANGFDGIWSATKNGGQWRLIQVNAYTAQPWYIPVYMSEGIGDYTNGGYLLTETPTRPYHAANKQFVENLPDYLTLTDEQKAKWREMVGALGSEEANNLFVHSASTSGIPMVYAVNRSGQTMYPLSSIDGAIEVGTIALYRNSETAGIVAPKATIVTANPQYDYQAANKKYVENLPDYLTLTDEQKAKWREMIDAGVEKEITFSDELKSVGTISKITRHDPDYFIFEIGSLVYSIQVGNTIYIGADKTPILVDYIVRIAGRTTIRTKKGVTLPEFAANVGDAVYIQEVSAIDGYLMKDTTAREEIAKIKQHLGIE